MKVRFALLDCIARAWLLVKFVGMRYGTVLLALPLCSSVCFLGLRFVLSTMGVSL